jgi:hypothetical protein
VIVCNSRFLNLNTPGKRVGTHMTGGMTPELQILIPFTVRTKGSGLIPSRFQDQNPTLRRERQLSRFLVILNPHL